MKTDALPLAVFCRPIPLAGLALMALNDHWLRVHWPCWLTGKLSDVGVVLYFPALLCALWGLFLWGCRRDTALTPRRVYLAAAFTAFSLAAINLSVAAKDLYVAALEALDVFDLASFRYVTDPSDCLALVFLPLAVWDGLRVARAESGGGLEPADGEELRG